MARYTSNRFKDIVIGLPNYSELKTALQVVGRVGIGTNNAKTPLWIEGNANIAGIITATTFKKEGGTNSQFLMADGSINNLSYLTTETSTLDEVLGRGNSTTKNLNVGIITATSIVGIASTALLANTATTAGYATTAGISTYSGSAGIATYATDAGISTYAGTAGISTISQGLTGSPSIVVDQITANNISVGQTLTYEDVTSVDSVGMVTARSGIHIGPITAGVATVTTDGDATFIGIVTASSFTGNGANVTNLNLGQLSNTGTVPTARLGTGTADSTTFLSGDQTYKTIDISSLNADNLSSGTIPDDRFPSTLPAISGANLTDVLTTDGGGSTANLIVAGISSLGIATAGDSTPGKTDLYYHGDLKLKTTNAGVQVLGIMSATALDFTGASGAFANDVIFQGSSYNLMWDKSASILKFNDGAQAVFGTGGDGTSDLKIFHSGSNSYINEDGTGDLFITTGIGTTAAKVSDGSITLYHQGTERLKTTSSGVTITGDISGTISGTINGNASTATDLSFNATQQLVIQTGNNATEAFSTGTAGQVLQSNGSGNAPTWEAAAPANAIAGLTIRKDDIIVGTANSVSTLNFAGTGIAVTFTNPSAGIATVTVSSGGGSEASSVMMSMIF